MNLGKIWFKSRIACGIVPVALAVCMITGCGKGTEAKEVSASSEAFSEAATETVETETAVTETTETETAETETVETGITEDQTDEVEETMRLYVNDKEISVAWEDNESVDALRELAANEPLTIELSAYGGFEQVGPIGTSLPRNDKQTTTKAGDIVLYSGNQIVMFYGSNSWSYTRLGHVQQMSQKELTKLLGQESVTLKISAR